jgi:AAA15 family ATPase/GTPase
VYVLISSFNIKNFKSIDDLTLPIGRLNVFIGENGAGKSNILEAIALSGAASAAKLDNEFLTSRGIRVTAPSLMKSAFNEQDALLPVVIHVVPDIGGGVTYTLVNDGQAYSNWTSKIDVKSVDDHIDANIQDIANDEFSSASLLTILQSFLTSKEVPEQDRFKVLNKMAESMSSHEKSSKKEKNSPTKPVNISIELGPDNPLTEYFLQRRGSLSAVRKSISDFIIYSPESSALRDFQREGQILPLGINGEGLFKLLDVEIASQGESYLNALNSFLSVFGWFESITLSKDDTSNTSFEISDRYICRKSNRLDLKVANEGFLFLVFYFSLFSSKLTPRFFAIDNIDASLNPKLCRKLIEELSRLATENNKQVLLTTHNPAILDGLDLDDDEQRLIIVSRDFDGQTDVRRVKKPKHLEGAPLLRLSEAFMRGSLGGLPKGF